MSDSLTRPQKRRPDYARSDCGSIAHINTDYRRAGKAGRNRENGRVLARRHERIARTLPGALKRAGGCAPGQPGNGQSRWRLPQLPGAEARAASEKSVGADENQQRARHVPSLLHCRSSSRRHCSGDCPTWTMSGTTALPFHQRAAPRLVREICSWTSPSAQPRARAAVRAQAPQVATKQKPRNPATASSRCSRRWGRTGRLEVKARAAGVAEAHSIVRVDAQHLSSRRSNGHGGRPPSTQGPEKT
jgi:hypothetical protein